MSVHAKRDITPKPQPPQVSSEHVIKSPRDALALATQEKRLTEAKLKSKSNADTTRVQTRSARQNLTTNDKSLVPKGDQQAHGTHEQLIGLQPESPKSQREPYSVGNSDHDERSRSRSSSPHHSENDHDSHYLFEVLQLEVRASEQALQLEKQAALLQKQTALIAQYRSERESQLQWNATENSNHEGKYTSGQMKVESTPEFRPSRHDWNPTPATPRRQHSREVSPTRSVLSMHSDRQPTQTERTTAGLKQVPSSAFVTNSSYLCVSEYDFLHAIVPFVAWLL